MLTANFQRVFRSGLRLNVSGAALGRRGVLGATSRAILFNIDIRFGRKVRRERGGLKGSDAAARTSRGSPYFAAGRKDNLTWLRTMQ